jgi:hypothetical protein
MHCSKLTAVIHCLLGAAVVALTAPAAEAQQVGTAAAVNPAAQARGSGGARTIVIGQSIAHRERIQTTSAGSVQLLFMDKTSMTIGPNSDLAIDEYVYDPATNTGKLAATLTKGLMRFVGGQISHAGNAQVTTPNAVVGIRGGVGIFSPQSIFIGYGEGNVRSGSSIVTLGAGEYTKTQGGGIPPTNPGPPPPNFLQTVLALLQSQAGQGGGARATPRQINQARTNASGTPTGTIANNAQNVINQPASYTQTNTITTNSQTIQTTANQTQVQTIPPPNNNPPPNNPPPPTYTPPPNNVPQQLTAFTGGLVSSDYDYNYNYNYNNNNNNNSGPFGPIIAALGKGFVQTNAQNQIEQANFDTQLAGEISVGNPNPSNVSDKFNKGSYYYGPNSANININNLQVGGNVLLPSTTAPGGGPAAKINEAAVSEFTGGLVEIPQAGGFICQCEYTRWGLWVADTRRSGQSGGDIGDTALMFWVAGTPSVSIPTTGSAVYTGHAIANIQNGASSYVAAGQFQSGVDYAARTQNVTINSLDGTNYAGQINYNSGSPTFGGTLNGSNNGRSMLLNGSFFQGATSPVGEMGGALQITGASNYGGAGIFAGKIQ